MKLPEFDFPNDYFKESLLSEDFTWSLPKLHMESLRYQLNFIHVSFVFNQMSKKLTKKETKLHTSCEVFYFWT